jgi:hypothetical protein
MGYIDLSRKAEFVNSNKRIYKIGRTNNPYKRLLSYPKLSVPLVVIYHKNCKEAEKTLIDIFKEKFNQKLDIGNEYFEGDCNKMVEEICKVCCNNF